MKRLLLLTLPLLTLLATPHLSQAAGNCQTIYGGGETCPTTINFSIDKKVMAPGKGGVFVDSLSQNDPKFSVNDIVTFQLTVKNNSNTKLEKLSVKDTFPSELKFSSGVNGNYNDDKKTLTYTIDTIDPKKSKTVTITARVQDFAPTTPVTCVTNSALVFDKNGVNSSDTTSFCLQKNPATSQTVTIPQGPQMLPSPNGTKQMPPTGPEEFVLPLLAGMGTTGFLLKKISRT